MKRAPNARLVPSPRLTLQLSEESDDGDEDLPILGGPRAQNRMQFQKELDERVVPLESKILRMETKLEV